MIKWLHYFPVYERYFERYKKQSLTIYEIGVAEGALQFWKKCFGTFATIGGIDIEPRCKEYEECQINVRIGEQSDIVLDDGTY